VNHVSAFIVSERTINYIVASISWVLRTEHRPHLVKSLADIGIDTSADHWEEQLAKAMFVLNARAVAHRYTEPAATGFTYHWVPPLKNLYQLVKSIDCWLYQCAEGDVPENPLYQLFDKMIVPMLLRRIIYYSPEYDQAEWG
jgi:hypothetical protein